MPVDHYENFPVASILLPRHLREPIEAIYAFARSADDIADEGEAEAEQRLVQLHIYHAQLDLIERGNTPADAMFARLARAVRTHALPVQLLRDLLDAFAQDVVKKRYASFAEVLDYSRRSANPIGRLLLRLYRADSEINCQRSDAICSSLQIINFWQDIAVDWQKGRIYLPQDEMQNFGIDEQHIALQRIDPQWQQLMRFQVTRAREMMQKGAPLAAELPGRVGFELRLMIAGGLRVLHKIEAVNYDIFRHRPVLKKWDWLKMFCGTFVSFIFSARQVHQHASS